jgi:hypothetical protein
MALPVVRARVYRYIVRLRRQRWLPAECCRNCHRSSGRYQLQPRGTDRQPAKRERPNSDLAGWRQNSRRTNSRLRLGIAPCLEVLVDLPTYFVTVRGTGGLRLFRCGPGDQMADQSGARRFRSFDHSGRRVADRGVCHRWTRRPTISTVPLVAGTRRRLGHQRHVDELLYPG